MEIEPAPDASSNDLKQVAAFALRLQEAERELAEKTENLRVAYDAYKTLAEVELPALMTTCGIKDYTLTNGTKVKVEQRYIGSKITDPDALKWIKENDGEAIIKNTITIELPVNETQAAKSLFEAIRNHPAANKFSRFVLEQSVNHMTIASFVKECVARQLNPPLERLGVIRRVAAKLSNSPYRSVEIKGLEERK